MPTLQNNRACSSLCSALRKLYDGTNGRSWGYARGNGFPWFASNSSNPCSWVGMSCTGSTCDTLLTSFTLDNIQNMRGEVYSTLGTDLARASGGKLDSFSAVNTAGLCGDLGAILSGLTSLTYISVENNGFTSSTDTLQSIFDSNPVAWFNADKTFMAGDFPKLNSELQQFRCVGCRLSGSIPDLSASKTLTHLLVGFNNIYGPLPNLPASLIQLDISRNALTGTIPLSFQWLVNLTLLDLSSNQLYGPLGNLRICRGGTSCGHRGKNDRPHVVVVRASNGAKL